MSELGTLETQVMEALWGQPAATVREVAARLPPTPPRAYTTVMTTLDRLHRKGLVTREKDGLAYRYQAALPREAHARQLADTLAAELLTHGDAGLAALVDATASGALLDRLAALVNARRAAR